MRPARFTLAPTVTTDQGRELTGIVVGDFNADGSPDLVAAANTNIVLFTDLTNDNIVNFVQSGVFSTGAAAAQYAISGDFNGDGNLDTAVANNRISGSVSVLLGDGQGAFTLAGNFFADGNRRVNAVSAADFDADGLLDIFSTINGNEVNTYGSQVFRGDGHGNLTSVFLSSSSGASSGAADFNGDGLPDMSLTEAGINILLGNGDMSFGQRTRYEFNDMATHSVADFNNDGKPDVAAVHYYGADVAILLNECTEPFTQFIDLSLTQTDSPDPVHIGQDLTYTLRAKNTSIRQATGVTITDVLPAGVQFAAASADCAESGGTVTCSIGVIPANSSAARSVTVRLSVSGPITNMATVTAAEPDLNATDNRAAAVTTVILPPQIFPSTATVAVNGTQTFTGANGQAPYSFSLAVNNSGGSVDQITGLYRAGTVANVSDTVRETDAGGGTADATVSIIPGAANRLHFRGEPSNTAAGQFITPAVQVAVEDSFGNLLTGAVNVITVSYQSNPGGGTLAGTRTRNAVGGIATFDDLSISLIGTGYSFRGLSGTLITAISRDFNIVVGDPARLGFTVQPSDTVANSVISPPVQVSIFDSQGNLVTTATDPVTIAIGGDPSGGTLSGTVTKNAVGGVAVFDDLSIDIFGVDYSLNAASGSLTPVLSDPFTILSRFTVTNTNDAGPGSLRQAILNANATPGTQTIDFAIFHAAPFTISPNTELPVVTDAVVIDGTTQSGFAGTPIIELSGANIAGAVDGLKLTGGNSTVRGLVIDRFWNGLTSAASDTGTGIRLEGGGSNIVEGNYIGTNASGTSALPNGSGIVLTSPNNQIGGITAASRNVISGNKGRGIGLSSTGNTVKGNYIGTDAGGAFAIGNSAGVMVLSSGNTLGGTTPQSRNIISGNSTGISTYGSSNTILGNWIGQNALGDPLGNHNEGILVSGNSSDNTITDNVVTANTGEGIWINARSGNRVQGNSIFSNGRLGINLGTSSTAAGAVEINDPQDPDAGPNDLQNYPVLTLAVTGSGTTVVQGTLNSTPTRSFTLEFFSGLACDASGNGEGQTPIGSRSISTGAGGIAPFSLVMPVPTVIGHFITATATDAQGNTSEFSRCRVLASNAFSITGRALDNNSLPLPNTLIQLSGGQSTLATTDGNGNYAFDHLPGGVAYDVAISLSNYSFAPPNHSYPILAADQSGQDFTGTKTRFAISGLITTAIHGGVFPLSGVRVNLSGSSAQIKNTNAVYFFNDLTAGTYSVMPSKDGYDFTPTNVNITGSDQTVSFLGVSSSPLTGRIVFVSSAGTIGGINADGTAYVPSVVGGQNISPRSRLTVKG